MGKGMTARRLCLCYFFGFRTLLAVFVGLKVLAFFCLLNRHVQRAALGYKTNTPPLGRRSIFPRSSFLYLFPGFLPECHHHLLLREVA